MEPIKESESESQCECLNLICDFESLGGVD